MLKVHQLYSQNHRMLGVGRDLCGSSSPTPLPKPKCFTAQGWTKVRLYIHRYTEEARERTGIIDLSSTEKSLQTRLGCAVCISNKKKYEQLENY